MDKLGRVAGDMATSSAAAVLRRLSHLGYSPIFQEGCSPKVESLPGLSSVSRATVVSEGEPHGRTYLRHTT